MLTSRARTLSDKFVQVFRQQLISRRITSGHRFYQTARNKPNMPASGPSNSFAELRKPYHDDSNTFDVKDLVSKEPFENFRAWFDEACDCKAIYEANAMSLATATKQGKPSVRVVLMKGFDRTGFTFFTNYESRKGKELNENPSASLMFFWEPLKKSIRIEGNVKKLSRKASEEYFNSRPRASQLSACVSNQSTVIASRECLVSRRNELAEQYSNELQPIPMPDYWGGYVLEPDYFEFWNGNSSRLHDRLVFRRVDSNETIDQSVTNVGEDGWVFERLSP